LFGRKGDLEKGGCLFREDVHLVSTGKKQT